MTEPKGQGLEEIIALIFREYYGDDHYEPDLQKMLAKALRQAQATQMPSREESTKRAKEVWGPNGDTLFISGWKSCYYWIESRMK